ncbi:MAG: hypothetical protein KDD45_17490 [Bdellovibrionales bacterium]|nr:hypothetical protein [Bdellovibrionales bacterium]
MVFIFLIKGLIGSVSHKKMHNEVLDEIRTENPNYDKELEQAMKDAQERLRRQDIYKRAMKKKGEEIGFGYQVICNDDESWYKIEKDLLDTLNS